jgi:hypothetical protein
MTRDGVAAIGDASVFATVSQTSTPVVAMPWYTSLFQWFSGCVCPEICFTVPIKMLNVKHADCFSQRLRISPSLAYRCLLFNIKPSVPVEI